MDRTLVAHRGSADPRRSTLNLCCSFARFVFVLELLMLLSTSSTTRSGSSTCFVAGSCRCLVDCMTAGRPRIPDVDFSNISKVLPALDRMKKIQNKTSNAITRR